MDKFDKGVELWETGHIRAAKKIYKEVILEIASLSLAMTNHCNIIKGTLY